jgi:hypothetical protein
MEWFEVSNACWIRKNMRRCDQLDQALLNAPANVAPSRRRRHTRNKGYEGVGPPDRVLPSSDVFPIAEAFERLHDVKGVGGHTVAGSSCSAADTLTRFQYRDHRSTSARIIAKAGRASGDKNPCGMPFIETSPFAPLNDGRRAGAAAARGTA